MPERPTDKPGRLEYVQRTLARGAVIAGASFWVIAGVALYASGTQTLNQAIFTTIWPFLGTVVAIVAGWLNERLASLLLFAAAGAVGVWGIIYGWNAGAWGLMTSAVMGPTAVSATLFLLAARAQERREIAAEHEERRRERAAG